MKYDVTFDIHDRVNYALKLKLMDSSKEVVVLNLTVDTEISLMDYFEIFLARMLMCRRAADFLKVRFELIINDIKLL